MPALNLSTEPLFRPHQVQNNKDELKRIERQLSQPGADVGEMRRHKNKLEAQLLAHEPKPFTGAELDAAVAEEKRLRAKILEGMPTSKEMRRAPPGAVDKHRRWEAKNKTDILRWKNVRLRLFAGGDESDTANLEQYRPYDASHSLSMDNALIKGKSYHYGDVEPGVVMTDAEEQKLAEIAPDLRDVMGTVSNSTRATILDLVRDVIAEDEAPSTLPVRAAKAKPKTKTKRMLSPEQRKAVGKRLRDARIAKQESQAAAV